MTDWIKFVDPRTGENFDIKPDAELVELAYNAGLEPATNTDEEKAWAVLD